MRISWFTGITLLFLIGTVISVTIQGQYFGESEANIFYKLINPTFTSFTNPLTAVGGFFLWVLDWIKALWVLFTWDYAFLTGSWYMLRVAGWAVSVSFVVGIVMAIRGTGSS